MIIGQFFPRLWAVLFPSGRDRLYQVVVGLTSVALRQGMRPVRHRRRKQFPPNTLRHALMEISRIQEQIQWHEDHSIHARIHYRRRRQRG